MSETANIHGTAIAVAGRAVLLRGKPGAGKSDLALRCLAVAAGPFANEAPMLIADDRVMAIAEAVGIRVYGPNVLRGLIEVRGIGIVHVPSVPSALLALVADLVAPQAIARMPEPRAPAIICGVEVPCISLAPFEASAPLKLLLALAEQTGDATSMRKNT